MPFVIAEDVGTTRRGSLSGKRRLQTWERTKGTCVICDERIDGVRERWIVEHIRALELGGADAPENLGPAHERCARSKTRDDNARTARAKRQKLRHLGAVEAARPVPGSRATAFKRKINGMVVLRAEALRSASGPPAGSRPAPSVRRESSEAESGAGRRNRTVPRPLLRELGNGSRTEPVGATLMTTAKTAAPLQDHAPPPGSGEILPALPRHLDFLFEERPLLPGESSAQYDALLHTIVAQVTPTDAIEAIWVKDIVDLIWEAKRLRRWRGQILVQARLDAAATLMMPVLEAQDPDPMKPDFERRREAETLAMGWLNGSAREARKTDGLLRERGLTAADVTAQAFQLKLPEIERIEQMIASADHRRDALLREVERKRASLGRTLRAAASNVIDVEPSERGDRDQGGPRLT